MNYWQISAEIGNTNLVDIFFDLGVAIVGPGDKGNYFDNKEEYELLEKESSLIKKFAEEVKVGDILILKQINSHDGSFTIVGVGKVTSPYRFEPIFDKVGIDRLPMQHCRRVKWYIPTDGLVLDKEGINIGLQKLKEDSPLKIKAQEFIDELKEE
ncbi:hypothetical protein [Clostridium sp. B9]|uniref:hypothetical protein n=1 Tax=Clostridium sp. B9 TaxID=3423224 RepID=UPI003D2F0062